MKKLSFILFLAVFTFMLGSCDLSSLLSGLLSEAIGSQISDATGGATGSALREAAISSLEESLALSAPSGSALSGTVTTSWEGSGESKALDITATDVSDLSSLAASFTLPSNVSLAYNGTAVSSGDVIDVSNGGAFTISAMIAGSSQSLSLPVLIQSSTAESFNFQVRFEASQNSGFSSDIDMPMTSSQSSEKAFNLTFPSGSDLSNLRGTLGGSGSPSVTFEGGAGVTISSATTSENDFSSGFVTYRVFPVGQPSDFVSFAIFGNAP